MVQQPRAVACFVAIEAAIECDTAQKFLEKLQYSAPTSLGKLDCNELELMRHKKACWREPAHIPLLRSRSLLNEALQAWACT